MPELAPARSYLYAPGSRPEVMEKALASEADAVILDLEDAVAPSEKDVARSAVAACIAAHVADARRPIHVRINRGSDDDLAAIVGPGLAAVRLPKVESADEVRAVASRLDVLERDAGLPAGAIALFAIIESAAGVAAVAEVAAAPRVARLCFGATDFLADIGAGGEPDGPATLLARLTLVLRSRVAGIGAPVDCVHTAMHDESGLRAAARSARELGFFGKSVIHPRQIGPVHEAFTPTDDEVARARRVVAADGGGAGTVDGEFVDPAVVARARATLALTLAGERGR